MVSPPKNHIFWGSEDRNSLAAALRSRGGATQARRLPEVMRLMAFSKVRFDHDLLGDWIIDLR
jgi:hypothetical protein